MNYIQDDIVDISWVGDRCDEWDGCTHGYEYDMDTRHGRKGVREYISGFGEENMK